MAKKQFPASINRKFGSQRAVMQAAMYIRRKKTKAARAS